MYVCSNQKKEQHKTITVEGKIEGKRPRRRQRTSYFKRKQDKEQKCS